MRHIVGDWLGIKYWEYEDAPLREKLKNPNVKEVAKIYFENETKAYRFARALSEVKKRGSLRLKDCAKDLPLATWKRYLDFGVNVGILKHESSAYSFTDRYSKPLRNVSVYIKSWIDAASEDKVEILFANAKMQKQQKRGGRQASQLAQAEQIPKEPIISQEEKKMEGENVAA
ncbi:MAG: hypothetical protein KGH61_03375 [Candidatus Micrarchaeota archaeon]|nr:hypothetical protein [Candidatus Micrarchaeota archaeon]